MDNEEAPRKFNWSLFINLYMTDGRTDELTNIKASMTTEYTGWGK